MKINQQIYGCTNSILEDWFSAKLLIYSWIDLNLFPYWSMAKYISSNIEKASEFKEGKTTKLLACINLNSDNEVVNWSFHLTKVDALIVENKHLDAH